MSRKQDRLPDWHLAGRDFIPFPKCNIEENKTSASYQYPHNEREEKKVEKESAQVPASQVLTEIQGSERRPGQGHDQVSTLVKLAESYLAAGEVQRAIALLERAVAGNSRDLHLPRLLGKAREALGDDKGAVDAYLTAIERGAWDPEVEAALLRDDFLLKTYPHSAEVLLGLTARQESVPLWRRLARLCETQGDYKKATSLLAEAVRVKPDDVASLSVLARIAERRQEFEQAAEWHQRVLAIRPDLRASLFFLAQRHYAQGEYGQAIPYFERLLFQERGNRLGTLYWLLSNVKGYGVHGLEERIGEVLRWRDLKVEEQPLVQELLVVAGEECLRGDDLERAEQYLTQAYQIASSTDVGRLLAVIENRKGEQAQRDGHLLHACVRYQRAAEYDPANSTYAQQAAQVAALRAAERKQRHREKYQRVGLAGVAVLLLLGGILSVRQARERRTVPSTQEGRPAVAVQEQTMALPEEAPFSTKRAPGPETTKVFGAGSSTAEERPQVPGEEQQKEARGIADSQEVINQGRVETAMALGMQVSGAGSVDPARSSAAIQEVIEEHLADLRAVYDQERAANPALIGSLVLDLTIEPSGQTSRVRLLSAKLTNRRIPERVLALAHTWRFSPATGRVRVFYPLLFLPPGVDSGSVIAWEKGTAAVRRTQSTSTSVPYASAEESLKRRRIEQESARQKLRSGNTPALSRDVGNTRTAAQPGEEDPREAPFKVRPRFVRPQSEYSTTR